MTRPLTSEEREFLRVEIDKELRRRKGISINLAALARKRARNKAYSKSYNKDKTRQYWESQGLIQIETNYLRCSFCEKVSHKYSTKRHTKDCIFAQ